MIGGNTTALLQTKTATKNSIGEYTTTYTDLMTVKGWLDLNSTDSRYEPYNAHIKSSSHVLVCDYVDITANDTNLSALIDGKRYDVSYIDDPQGRHRQIEIYLNYVGV